MGRVAELILVSLERKRRAAEAPGAPVPRGARSSFAPHRSQAREPGAPSLSYDSLHSSPHPGACNSCG